MNSFDNPVYKVAGLLFRNGLVIGVMLVIFFWIFNIQSEKIKALNQIIDAQTQEINVLHINNQGEIQETENMKTELWGCQSDLTLLRNSFVNANAAANRLTAEVQEKTSSLDICIEEKEVLEGQVVETLASLYEFTHPQANLNQKGSNKTSNLSNPSKVDLVRSQISWSEQVQTAFKFVKHIIHQLKEAGSQLLLAISG